jgi:hypothetical protein
LKVAVDPDVHRDQVTACIATGPLDRAKEKFIVKEFSAMTYRLREGWHHGSKIIMSKP